MRGIRSTVKAKPKSLAKESVGSIKDGASLISAVASDLTMAKRLGFDEYLGTQMESTLSSSAPNMRPLVFSQAEALFNQELVKGDVAVKAIEHKKISQHATHALTTYRAVVKKAKVLAGGKCAVPFAVAPANCLAAAHEISTRIQIDSNFEGRLKYPDSNKSDAVIYGGWGGEGYTNTRDDRAVPSGRRWVSLGTAVPEGYTLLSCDSLASELKVKKVTKKDYVFTAAQFKSFKLYDLKLTHCVAIDKGEPTEEYFHPAAQYTPAVKAEQDILVYHVPFKNFPKFLEAFPRTKEVVEEVCVKLRKLGIPLCPPSRDAGTKDQYQVGAFNLMFQGGPGAIWDKHQDAPEFISWKPRFSSVTQLSAGKSSVQVPYGDDLVGKIEYQRPGDSVAMHSNMWHGTGSAELRTVKIAIFVRAVAGADDNPIFLVDEPDAASSGTTAADAWDMRKEPQVVKEEPKAEAPAPTAGTEPSSLEPPSCAPSTAAAFPRFVTPSRVGIADAEEKPSVLSDDKNETVGAPPESKPPAPGAPAPSPATPVPSPTKTPVLGGEPPASLKRARETVPGPEKKPNTPGRERPPRVPRA